MLRAGVQTDNQEGAEIKIARYVVRAVLPVLAAAVLLTACGGGKEKEGKTEEQKSVFVAVEKVGPGRVEDMDRNQAD